MNSSYYDALTARDPAFEGVFLYAVTTTGVYCRPTCKSRRPLVRNVRFFADAAGARSAGFRACKRCRPDDGGYDAQPEWLAQACRFLDESEEAPTLDELAAHVGVSRAHLQRTFTKAIGVSPRRYAATLREGRLRTALRSGATVSAANRPAHLCISSVRSSVRLKSPYTRHAMLSFFRRSAKGCPW